jgi:hypothetical protein
MAHEGCRMDNERIMQLGFVMVTSWMIMTSNRDHIICRRMIERDNIDYVNNEGFG